MTRFQIGRHIFFKRHPELGMDDYRWNVNQHVHGAKVLETNIFDWQITPPLALCDYLDRDFEGVFERADLAPTHGETDVAHTWLRTYHPHSFHPGDDGIYSHELIDREYSAAASKFGFLANRFREMLNSEVPVLFVIEGKVDSITFGRLMYILSDRVRATSWKVLALNTEIPETASVFSDDRVVFGCVGNPTDKPPERCWEGDDAQWDRALQPYDLARISPARLRL